MITTSIKSGDGGGVAKVTSRGQLVTAPLEFSEIYTASCIANNTAVNLVTPKPNQRFVITTIILNGDRSIAVNGAITDLFESIGGPISAVVSKSILRLEILKQGSVALTGLNIILSEGVWLNVKADDVIVRANIAGYYVSA